MTQTTLDPAAAQAIVEGRHGDPFAVLGPHIVGGEVVVTAFVPGAERLFLLGAKAAKPVEAQGVPGYDGLFQGVLALGGVITGEHGIGLAKQPWWADAVSTEAQALHQTIKRALDPEGILNPGKFLD